MTSPLINLYSAQQCQFTFIHLSKTEQTCSFSHSSHGQTADESGTYLRFRNVFLTSFKPQGCSEDEWRYWQCSDYDACKNERSICLDGQGRPGALLGCRQDHENRWSICQNIQTSIEPLQTWWVLSLEEKGIHCPHFFFQHQYYRFLFFRYFYKSLFLFIFFTFLKSLFTFELWKRSKLIIQE